MKYYMVFWDVGQGLVKTVVFAILIAGVGCLRGFEAREGAESVGRITTSAIVAGIFLIIVSRRGVHGAVQCLVSSTPAGPPAIQVEHLVARYGDGRSSTTSSFEVRRGEGFVIVGGSGCGKTTLLRHMIGLLRPAAGRVLIDGEDVARADEEQLRRIQRKFGVQLSGRRAVRLADPRRERRPAARGVHDLAARDDRSCWCASSSAW